jgi:radical SAM superfamily enzyme YgiQ (UPF0313 family)
MRILLVNTNRFKDPLPVMPIGLCWVAASLERAGHTVSFLDLCFSAVPSLDVKRRLEKFTPDLVGLSVRNIDTCNGYKPVFLLDSIKQDIVRPLRELFKGPLVVGGPAAGINGPEICSYFEADYAISGDGEMAMTELAACIESGKDPGSIPGLAERQNGHIATVNIPRFHNDIDALPVPCVPRYLDLSLYRLYKTPFQVQTKRGCALCCAYCTYNRIEGRVYRLRSPHAIADEIEAFVKATGIHNVEIVDSAFNAPLDHAKAVLKQIGSRGLHLHLSTMGLNPKYIDGELVSLMKKAGFMEACCGVEAAHDDMLRAFGKTFSVADIRSAADLLHRARIPSSWFLILGGPGETELSVRETIRTISRIASPWDFVNIAVGLRVYNGAPIAQTWADEHGGPPADNFLSPVAFVPGSLSMKRLKALASLATAWHHNFFMFDDGANVPLPIRVFLGTFFPKQPLWRGYIFMRMLEKITGVFLVRALAVWIGSRV